MLSINVNLRSMKTAVEFVWLDGGGAVIFVSNPTIVLRLCCVVAGGCDNHYLHDQLVDGIYLEDIATYISLYILL